MDLSSFDRFLSQCVGIMTRYQWLILIASFEMPQRWSLRPFGGQMLRKTAGLDIKAHFHKHLHLNIVPLNSLQHMGAIFF